jgi:hypothetical protein
MAGKVLCFRNCCEANHGGGMLSREDPFTSGPGAKKEKELGTGGSHL